MRLPMCCQQKMKRWEPKNKQQGLFWWVAGWWAVISNPAPGILPVCFIFAFCFLFHGWKARASTSQRHVSWFVVFIWILCRLEPKFKTENAKRWKIQIITQSLTQTPVSVAKSHIGDLNLRDPSPNISKTRMTLSVNNPSLRQIHFPVCLMFRVCWPTSTREIQPSWVFRQSSEMLGKLSNYRLFYSGWVELGFKPCIRLFIIFYTLLFCLAMGLPISWCLCNAGTAWQINGLEFSDSSFRSLNDSAWGDLEILDQRCLPHVSLFFGFCSPSLLFLCSQFVSHSFSPCCSNNLVPLLVKFAVVLSVFLSLPSILFLFVIFLDAWLWSATKTHIHTLHYTTLHYITLHFITLHTYMHTYMDEWIDT